MIDRIGAQYLVLTRQPYYRSSCGEIITRPSVHGLLNERNETISTFRTVRTRITGVSTIILRTLGKLILIPRK